MLRVLHLLRRLLRRKIFDLGYSKCDAMITKWITQNHQERFCLGASIRRIAALTAMEGGNADFAGAKIGRPSSH
jgi:hypothetical protein